MLYLSLESLTINYPITRQPVIILHLINLRSFLIFSKINNVLSSRSSFLILSAKPVISRHSRPQYLLLLLRWLSREIILSLSLVLTYRDIAKAALSFIKSFTSSPITLSILARVELNLLWHSKNRWTSSFCVSFLMLLLEVSCYSKINKQVERY